MASRMTSSPSWPRRWRHHPHGLENDVIPPPWPRGFRHHPHGLEVDFISSIASGMTSLPHSLEDDVITQWFQGWRHHSMVSRMKSSLNSLEDDVIPQLPRGWRHSPMASRMTSLPHGLEDDVIDSLPHGLEDDVITSIASRMTSSPLFHLMRPYFWFLTWEQRGVPCHFYRDLDPTFNCDPNPKMFWDKLGKHWLKLKFKLNVLC